MQNHKSVIENKTEIKTLLALLAFVIAYHLCIMAKIIPYDIAWGGRIQNDQEMYLFESFSLLINILLGILLLLKGNYLKLKFSPKAIIRYCGFSS